MVRRSWQLKPRRTIQETDCRDKEELQNLFAANGRTKQCCGEHRRRLELFCQEDEAFICVLCVPRHSSHSFVFLHDVFTVYKDKLTTALSSLQRKVSNLKDLQSKNEKEFLDILEDAYSLQQYVTQEFGKLHQFLHDQEQKLIHQLKMQEAEVLNEMEANLNCVKSDVMSTFITMSDAKLVLKKGVEETLEDKKESNKCIKNCNMATQKMVSDKSELGKQETVDFLTVPEMFEDVAVTFSEEEWKMLGEQDKELHREVMVQNYESLVSVGYKIPPEKLLVLLKADYDELPKDDMEEKTAAEEKDSFEGQLSSIRSTENSVGCSLQPSFATSPFYHPTENLQHCTQHVKASNKLHLSPVLQLHSDHNCSKNPQFGTSLALQHIPVIHQTSFTVEKPYKCSKCSKCFSQNSHLKNHQATHTRGKSYKCPECSKCFSSSSNLIRHQTLHKGEKPFKCPECSKYFLHRSDLIPHLAIHTGVKPYKCIECSKCFSYSYSLMRHQSIHTGEKPYKCPECSKYFSQSSVMLRHQATHTGQKPYKCPECSKRFLQSSDMLRHQAIHTGEKPYKCLECSKCFSQKGSMIRHQAIHKRGVKQYECAECSKCFLRSGNMVRHQATHTGHGSTWRDEISKKQREEL